MSFVFNFAIPLSRSAFQYIRRYAHGSLLFRRYTLLFFLLSFHPGLFRSLALFCCRVSCAPPILGNPHWTVAAIIKWGMQWQQVSFGFSFMWWQCWMEVWLEKKGGMLPNYYLLVVIKNQIKEGYFKIANLFIWLTQQKRFHEKMDEVKIAFKGQLIFLILVWEKMQHVMFRNILKI